MPIDVTAILRTALRRPRVNHQVGRPQGGPGQQRAEEDLAPAPSDERSGSPSSQPPYEGVLGETEGGEAREVEGGEEGQLTEFGHEASRKSMHRRRSA